jgi:DNA-binding beta-propeller fold protein YncE
MLAATLCTPSAHNPETDKLDNPQIRIPANVAYALSAVDASVTVIDMDRDSIVGIQQTAVDDEIISDMAIGPDGMLYLAMCNSDLDHAGKVIRVFDPGKGAIVMDIEVDPDPERIYALPDGSALIDHQVCGADSGKYATTLLDMAGKKVKKVFRLNSMLASVPLASSGQPYLYYAQLDYYPFFPLSILYRLDTLGDSLQESMELNDSLFNGVMAFVGDDRVYSTAPASVTVHGFPSGTLLKTINIGKVISDMLALPNGKVYVSLNTDEAWQYGNYDSLRVIDVGTDEVVKTIQVCKGPESMAYSKALNKVYVAGYCGTTISAIDPDRDSVTKTIVSNQADEDHWGYEKIVVNR